jgi:hypothetical protein
MLRTTLTMVCVQRPSASEMCGVILGRLVEEHFEGGWEVLAWTAKRS